MISSTFGSIDAFLPEQQQQQQQQQQQDHDPTEIEYETIIILTKQDLEDLEMDAESMDDLKSIPSDISSVKEFPVVGDQVEKEKVKEVHQKFLRNSTSFGVIDNTLPVDDEDGDNEDDKGMPVTTTDTFRDYSFPAVRYMSASSSSHEENCTLKIKTINQQKSQ